MNYTEFIEEMYPSMAGLGYKKGNETNWTLRMPEIMVLSYVTFYSDMPQFDIELGIAFNQVHGDMSWKKYRRCIGSYIRWGNHRKNLTRYFILVGLRKMR
jgi:hypothetical protein